MSAHYISAGLVIGTLTMSVLNTRNELDIMRTKLDKLEKTINENSRKINLNSDSIDIIRKSITPPSPVIKEENTDTMPAPNVPIGCRYWLEQ